MRIRRLDITGFKSFMDRTVLSFGAGVTGIVGPNGCGKSNVVDAIRWAMGEQSAKHLRGRGMEDVIFAGSETHAALSLAEVTITFEVQEQDVLAPQYAGLPEVSVTRRLFRSGESEYLINKAPCRLLDITELFLGTGVGTRAYSIIEQGRVGLIVSSKPEDRRTFIEEAAGVTKYKARRRAAERKMEYTQQNLLRIQDIVTELERQLESLKRQARKAEKYKKLRAEIREVELHQAAHRYLELHASQQVLEARVAQLSTEERAALDEVRSLEAAIFGRREALEREAVELEGMSGAVHGLEAQVQLDEQNLSHWNQDLEATERRLEQARTELGQLGERESQLSRSRQERESERELLAAAWKEDDVALQVVQEELRRVNALELEIGSKLEAERGELVEVASRLANHSSRLEALGRRRGDLEVQMAKNRAEYDVLGVERAQLESVRRDVQEQIEKGREATLLLDRRRGEEEAQLGKTREAFAQNEIQVICLREELADKRSRLASLQEIQKNYEGFDRGVRAVMRHVEGTTESGVFGLVADVVSTEPMYEKAIEAALGERLQHVIVEDQVRALELVEHLRTLSEGRSTFVPLRTGRLPQLAAEVPAGSDGFLVAAFDAVRCDAALAPVVQGLLHGTLIVRDLAAARQLAAQQGAGLTLVTLDGEVLRADGTVTGGVMEGPAVGSLQKKREIAELTTELGELEARYNEIVTRHYQLQKQMGHTEVMLKGLSKDQHQEELALAAREKDLHKAGEDLARLRERLGALDTVAAELAESLRSLELEEEASRGEVAHSQTDRERREEQVRLMAAELETLRAKASGMAEDITALRVKAAASAEKSEAARLELERLAHQAAENALRQTKVADALAEDTVREQELRARLEETAQERTERSTQLAEQRSTLESRRAAHTAGVAETRDQEARLREQRERLDGLTQGLSKQSLQERELALELDHLVRQVEDRHQTQLGQELHRFHLLPPLSREAELGLRDLRAQIERMGEINLTAIEEHDELAKRFDFMTRQKKDLEASLETLRAAIVKIDKTSRERFNMTFEMVNERFQQIFPRLFGGGRAGLVLTDEGAGVEAGVEIVAQPPGKKLQSVGLLSGGEKALTAVSLIFAIFLIKPTPFCLLDEVDAPLDDANVGRYNDMVREMAKQSQFILITHNKRTMEIVGSLYGVTMEEPGVSKVVSVRLREAEAANTDTRVA